MVEITCQECKGELLVDDATAERGRLNGSIIEGEYVAQQRVGWGETDFRNQYMKAFLYVCAKCQAKASRSSRPHKSIETERAEYQRIIGEIRKEFPELALEDAVARASVLFHDVRKVRHPGFRAYLMERIG
jgi:hypothetical protein